jgi:hypothetical protein
LREAASGSLYRPIITNIVGNRDKNATILARGESTGRKRKHVVSLVLL